jgi:hypothetical protein
MDTHILYGFYFFFKQKSKRGRGLLSQERPAGDKNELPDPEIYANFICFKTGTMP